MKSILRKVVGVLISASAIFGSAQAMAQSWPTKPGRIVIAFPSGSASDSLARLVAEALQTALGQPFVVDQRPGASGVIAASAVANAEPDGYTLLLTSANLTGQNAAFFKDLPYDPVKDFTPIGRISMFPFLLVVNSQLPIKSVPQLIEYAHQHKGLNYAYGNGTGQVAGAAFNTLAKLGATAIGYKGSAQALTELAGGQTAFMFADHSSSQPFVQSGRVLPIAVSSEARSELAPDLPTVAEAAQLPGFDLGSWLGLVGPAGMPLEITEKLSNTLYAALQQEAVKQNIRKIGGEPASLAHAEFGQYIEQQVRIWGEKVREAGIPPQ